jgi:hypothetical protein
MPVQQTIPFEEGTFFITFTRHKWMNLVETTIHGGVGGLPTFKRVEPPDPREDVHFFSVLFSLNSS